MKLIVKAQTVVLCHDSMYRLGTLMTITPEWLRARALAAGLLKNTSGLAAVEFAMILPIMLVLFFGTVEMSNGVAVYRKVTLMAHTLSDLTSQSVEVQDSDLTNFFAASTGVMTPYSATPIAQTITEIWVNPSGQARVQWSSGSSPLTPGTTFGNLPSNLAVPNSYVIYSQVSYLYTPAVGYIMSKTGVTLSDFAYTRPRQFACVLYDPPMPLTSPPPSCPQH
jgi:Flp pilus assembly protein TadG